MCAHVLYAKEVTIIAPTTICSFVVALLETLQVSKCIGAVLDVKAVGRMKREQGNAGTRKGIQKVVVGLVFQAIGATPYCANK